MNMPNREEEIQRILLKITNIHGLTPTCLATFLYDEVLAKMPEQETLSVEYPCRIDPLKAVHMSHKCNCS